MKPLILSFFAVIFVYSFFFDKKEEQAAEPATINTRSTQLNQVEPTEKADSTVFYAHKYMYSFELSRN